MKGGFFGAPEERFVGDFRAAARRRWAVLPRNSGVFEWREGAARRFRARRTLPGTRGEKIFKKFLKTCEKPKNWGARGAEGRSERTLYRACGAIFRHDFWLWRLGLWQRC